MNIKTPNKPIKPELLLLLKIKAKKNEVKYKETIGGLCGCNLRQLYEGVVGFECLSNLAHVGDLVSTKTVNSSFNKTHKTQNEGNEYQTQTNNQAKIIADINKAMKRNKTK